jgi:hypothetical protein
MWVRDEEGVSDLLEGDAGKSAGRGGADSELGTLISIGDNEDNKG